jgi:hypothetical protein
MDYIRLGNFESGWVTMRERNIDNHLATLGVGLPASCLMAPRDSSVDYSD